MVFLKAPRTIVPRSVFHIAKAPKLVVSARIRTFRLTYSLRAGMFDEGRTFSSFDFSFGSTRV